MTVAVTEECIGTAGCLSKPRALRVRIKQSCEVGTVCVPSETLCNSPMGTQPPRKGSDLPRKGFCHAGGQLLPLWLFPKTKQKHTNGKEDARFLPTLKGLGSLAPILMNPTVTIEYNAKPNFYTLSEIKQREPDYERWTLRNDMIASVRIWACDYGFLQLGIDYKSGEQGVGYGYRSEGNIGLMIQGLASLLGVKYINGDILKEMEGKPIRVLFKQDCGGSVAGCTYIGHFMEDKFIKMSELIMVGIINEKEGGAK